MFFTKKAPQELQRDIWYEANRQYLFRNFGLDIGPAYVAPSRYQQCKHKIKIKFEETKRTFNRWIPRIKRLLELVYWLGKLFWSL